MQFIFCESDENDEFEQFIYVETNTTHTKRKHNYRRFQFASFIVSEIFLFKLTRFIRDIARTHARSKRNVDVTKKHHHQKLS